MNNKPKRQTATNETPPRLVCGSCGKVLRDSPDPRRPRSMERVFGVAAFRKTHYPGSATMGGSEGGCSGTVQMRCSTTVRTENGCRSTSPIGNHGMVTVDKDIFGGGRDGLNSCSCLACRRSRAPQPYRPSLATLASGHSPSRRASTVPLHSGEFRRIGPRRSGVRWPAFDRRKTAIAHVTLGKGKDTSQEPTR
jgi:hypothetical protein